jgi:hypothetical protein
MSAVPQVAVLCPADLVREDLEKRITASGELRVWTAPLRSAAEGRAVRRRVWRRAPGVAGVAPNETSAERRAV